MKKIIATLLIGLSLTACQDLTELNEVTKDPVSVQAGSLFAASTISLFDLMTDISVNRNIFRYMAQHWTATTYTDEANFNLDGRDINGYAFNEIYADVIRDMREAAALIEADANLLDDVRSSQLAATELVQIYGMSVLVDVFGDVPYTEAFSKERAAGEIEFTPVYDDDAAIYADLIDRTQAAIANLKGTDNGLGEFDLVYGGDVTAWQKFGNTLLLHLAVRIAEVDASKAQSVGETAIASGLMESSADNYVLDYTSNPPHTNPIYDYLFIQNRPTDNVASNTLVDKLNELNDPRTKYFFQDEQVVDTVNGDMAYVGGVYGASNSYAIHSKPGAMMIEPTFPGTIMSYTEVEFLLADAAERGWAGAGEAEAHYNAAILSSILEWGGTQEEYETYIAQSSVAYATAEGDWKEKIGTQKWIGMYNQGFEAWSTYRFYDAPTLNAAFNSGQEAPSRYNYPQDEYSLNGENVKAAATAIGGDVLTSKVFWDMN